jgi:phospholipid/cholesterol/gamma-HCH transport system substrate-binding protein
VTTSARSSSARLVVLVATLLLTGSLAGCGLLGGGARTVEVELADSAGLFTGNDVGVLGVPVGKVTNIEPKGDHVTVTLEITDGDVKIPAGVNAAVVSRSVATDRYVELTPVYKGGAELEDGAVIPTERTVTPVDFDKVLASVDKLGRGLVDNPEATNSLKQLIDITADNLEGRGTQINRTIKSLSAAVGTTNAKSEDIIATMRSLDTLASALIEDEQTVRRFVAQVADASQLLADERDNLGVALTSLSRTADDVAAFAKANRGRIKRTTTDFTDVVENLVRARRDLAEIAQVLPLASDNLARARASNGNIRVRAELAQALPLGGSQLEQLCDAIGNVCGGLTVPPSPQELIDAITGGRQ